MATSYAPPTVSATGLTIPTYPAILQQLIALYTGLYGLLIYLGPDASDYQWLSALAIQIADLGQALQAVWLSFNLQYAIGTSLDLLGKLIGPSRNQATSSTVLLTVTGTYGTVINDGIAQDALGNYWLLPSTVAIPGSGSINVTATAQVAGNITANANTITTISSPTFGWTGVNNAGAATAGEAVEPDAHYRARLLISQAMPSLSLLAGTAADIATIPAVSRSRVYENPLGYTAGYGFVTTSGTVVTQTQGYSFDSSDIGQAIVINGVSYSIASVSSATTLLLTVSAGTQSIPVAYSIGGAESLGPAHSITCVVEGSTSTEIAQTIYNNKNPGCLTNGTTTVSVVDPNNGNIEIPISFDVLAYVEIYVLIVVYPLTGFTSATQAAIAAAVVAYLNSLGIGQSVIFSQIYAVAATGELNPAQPSVSIRELLLGTLAAQTTGNTATGSPNITLTSGTGTANGQGVIGPGIPATAVIISGGGTTSIVLNVNVTTGGTGVALSFFNLTDSDITVPYNSAAQSLADYVQVTML